MLKLISLAALSTALLAACGGSDDKKPSKVGPSDPKGLAQRPPNATPMGSATSIAPPNGGPSVSTAQPGDTGDEMFCWQEDIDENGSDDDCCVIDDDETGSLVLACAPYEDTCDDGEDLSAAILVIVHEDGSGTFALAGSDLCGSGADLIGCDFDSDGEVGACGACVIDGDDLICEDDGIDQDEDDDEEEQDDTDGDGTPDDEDEDDDGDGTPDDEEDF
ncbi:MAG: hypothetical protein AB7P03_20880 [Kofleriaceae bacterium]